jgi:hypothetical protein
VIHVDMLMSESTYFSTANYRVTLLRTLPDAVILAEAARLSRVGPSGTEVD